VKESILSKRQLNYQKYTIKRNISSRKINRVKGTTENMCHDCEDIDSHGRCECSSTVEKRDCLQFRYELSCHAEIDAIFKLPTGTNLRKVKLIVVREGMKMSKPCAICAPVIRALGIRKVYYSCEGRLERMVL
jgi:deoxycytidylate deaminase